MLSNSLMFCDEDHQYVTACLGYNLQGVLGVAVRRSTGEPTVIINLPLIHKNEVWHPVSTLYWLVDPDLNEAIAGIEAQGGNCEIQRDIASDTKLQLAHREDNKYYARARWAVLNDQEKGIAAQVGVRELLEHAGICGTFSHDAIKCLHAHYAFHLARREAGSTVGKLIDSRYGLSAGI